MAIEKTGAFFEDGETYVYGFSDSNGQLLISDGQHLTLTSVTTGPFLLAGGPGAGMPDPDALGAIIIRDMGSLLQVISSGSNVEGASLTLGRYGARGLMQIRDGAAFQMEDPFGADNSDNTGGGEGGWIGHGVGSQGTLEVLDGHFRMAGTGSNLSVGREYGIGVVDMREGSRFVMETTSDGTDDFTYLRIGINNGTGTMTIAESFALVRAGDNAGAAVDIGSYGGTGHITITSENEDPARDGLFVVGGPKSDFVQVRLGESGTAVATVDRGVLGVVNLGREIVPDLAIRSENQPGGDGGGARLVIGMADQGDGSLAVSNGGAVFVGGHLDTRTQIGVGDGSTGRLILESGARLETFSREGIAGLEVGEWEGVSTGILTMTGQSEALITGAQDSYVMVGRWQGSDGTLALSQNSELTVTSRMEGVNVMLGHDGATGEITLESGSTLTLNSEMRSAIMEIGRHGGIGSLTLTDSKLDISAPLRDDNSQPLDNTFAWVLVGTEGGNGALVLDNSEARVVAGQGAGFRVGMRWTDIDDNSGTGTMTLRNGAVVYAEALLEETNLWVGGAEGSEATVRIDSGSKLDLSGNGWAAIGYATSGMVGGGSGLLQIDGAGSLLVGARNLIAGAHGSHGTVQLSDGGRALVGALEGARNVNVNFGWGDGGQGTLEMSDALMSVQAGTGVYAGQHWHGASVSFGEQGGTGQASITGARANTPDAPHGLIVLGNANSDYADISIGRDGGSDGAVHVRGAFFGAQNDSTTFGADGPINLDGDGGYASVRIGYNGGRGALDIGGDAELFVISGAEDSAELIVGRGVAASGVLTVSDNTQVDLISRGDNAWFLIGTEGGAKGVVTISDSSLVIDAARNGGIRLGTSWFDSPYQVGTGQLMLTDGSDVTIRAQGNGANFFVGGGAGSDAQAVIQDSSVTMAGAGHRLVIVGGTPAFTAGTGGSGEMILQGADARLLGARDILVGTNGSEGRLELREGARVILEDAGGGQDAQTFLGLGIGRVRDGEADVSATGALVVHGADSGIDIQAAEVARLVIGANGGAAEAQVNAGASVFVNADISTIEIGVNGGIGRADVTGIGTRVEVAGADARIHLGRTLNPEAHSAGAGRGILTIGEGSEVLVSTTVELGDSGASGSVLAMSGGRLTTPLVQVYAGPAHMNNLLMGYGEIVGIAGQPAVLMTGASFFVGDAIDADGRQITSTGKMTITGDVVKQDSHIHFDIGADGGGYDEVTVTGAFAMQGGILQVSLLDGAQNMLAGSDLRLLSASDGIFLNEVALQFDVLPNGLEFTAELRAGGTELWAVLDGEAAPVVPLPAAWQDWLNWIGGGGGAPPPAPDVARGDTIADPHLVTLDGLAYDFHAVGEYVMTRATDGSFEVQARMAPVGENASENVAVAVRLDGGTVMVDAATADSVLVNGNPVNLLSGQSVMVGADLVYRTDNTWHMVHRHGNPEGDTISAVSATIVDGRLDISVFLDPVFGGQVNGLLGNFDGNPETDLALPDGQLVSRPLVFGDDPDAGVLGLYGAFRDAWRISEIAESLFIYIDGEGPNSFYLPDYPSKMFTLADFEQATIEAATASLLDAGLEQDSVAFNNALFDLLVTENPAYIQAAIHFQTQQAARPETAPEIAAPSVTGGALEGLLTFGGHVLDVTGGAMDGVRVTFTPQGQMVSHIRNARSEGAFEFDLLPNPDGGLVEASRAYDASVDGRPSALDALNVLRMAVGLQPSFGTAPGAAYIAADINADGKITALDALEVLRAAVGLQSVHTPRWVFIDSEADLSGLTRNHVEAPIGVRLGAMEDAIGDIGLTGILLGNLQEFA